MKIKKLLISIVTSAVMLSIPTQVFAWVQKYEYNIINIRIAYLLRFLAIAVGVAYAVVGMIYAAKSQQEEKVKFKNIIKWLIITIITVILLVYVARLVFNAGIRYY